MSLVAYDASSDEESESEVAPNALAVEKPQKVATTLSDLQKQTFPNGHISDDDDEFFPHTNANAPISMSNLSQILPVPKNNTTFAEVVNNLSISAFAALPTPKDISGPQDIKEEDDEFLHKKPSAEIIEKVQKNTEGKKMPVKIKIPSLKDFQDVDREIAEKAEKNIATSQNMSKKSSGLLNILPKAKSEQSFTKIVLSCPTPDTVSSTNRVIPAKPAFVPDVVKHRRPAANIEDVDRFKINKNKCLNQSNNKASLKVKVESDESDGENDSGDFFSFNTDQTLPEVSTNEINDLVAKKAAKMAETTKRILDEAENHKIQELERTKMEEQELENCRKRNHQEQQLNSDALQALIGGNSKRIRQQKDDIQVIDINSEQILPNKAEWMRTALASSTTYQPTGVLVDEEPASGTRRKHQITYLAHKAKANEAELQAMWSANRQSRRATQSKYGF